jgi:hypothetical protein
MTSIRPKIISNFSGVMALTLLMILSSCSSVPKRNPVPPELAREAEIPGVPEARFWSDELPRFTAERLAKFSSAEYRKHFSGIYGKPHHYLAISGGGANGAFGAGLLNGWSDSGKRPIFTMVTGISTGALAAPFAFLGSDYDDELKTLYTDTSTDQIIIKKSLLTAVFRDSIVDTKPLRQLIADTITVDMIDLIAQEHKRGRRLFIGTLNLEAGRPMIWSIGEIAVSEYPGKYELIHDILAASAAIPVVFPPVVIPVEVDGKSYDEMHVDGGTGMQVFAYPSTIDWNLFRKKLAVKGTPKVYVIRNSFLDLRHKLIKSRIAPIANRSIDSLIRTQGIGNLFHIYAQCVRDGNDFNLAYIPSDFDETPKERFDPVYMTKLFDLGYERGRKGYSWKKEPPYFKVNR